MFFRILGRKRKSTAFSERNIQKFDSKLLSMFMSHKKHFIQIFFWASIERSGKIFDSEALGKFGGDIHSHIVAARTFFARFFRCILKPTDSIEKIFHIIRSLDEWNFFQITNFFEGFKTLVILGFWLNIRVVPKTNQIIFILELQNRHHDIRSTTHMHQNTFLGQMVAIQPIFKNIKRNRMGKAWNQKFFEIIRVQSRNMRVFWNFGTNFCRRNFRKMRFRKNFKILNFLQEIFIKIVFKILARNKNFSNFLAGVIFRIPIWHRFYRIHTKNVHQIWPIFFACILIDITSNHLTVPIFHKKIIQNHTLITQFFHK